MVAGLGLGVGLWFLRGRRFPPIAAVVPLGLLALAVGGAQYLSLPAATGPRPIRIVLPIIAVVSALVGVVLAERGMRFAADAALLLVGAELWWLFAVPTPSPASAGAVSDSREPSGSPHPAHR